jgi:hypothetical protein
MLGSNYLCKRRQNLTLAAKARKLKPSSSRT